MQCSIKKCTDKSLARGWCSRHWQRWQKHGDPAYERPGFWDRVRIGKKNECWPWTGGTKGHKGQKYGNAWFEGKNELAHRVAWRLSGRKIKRLKGSDYRGSCVLHSCDFGLCCNPGHLFLGTHKHNMEDKCGKRRDTSKWKRFCVNGHRRVPSNLYTSKLGLRACRTCHRIRERKRKRRIARYKEQRKFSYSPGASTKQ